MNKGFHPLFRSLLTHKLWEYKPFGKGQAWVDLIMLANYDYSTVYDGSEAVGISPGQVVTSILALSKRWGWSRTKTVKFVTLLENDTMIRQQKRHRFIVITLLNYSTFVKRIEKKDTKKDKKKTSERHERDTSNEYKINKRNYKGSTKSGKTVKYTHPSHRPFDEKRDK